MIYISPSVTRCARATNTSGDGWVLLGGWCASWGIDFNRRLLTLTYLRDFIIHPALTPHIPQESPKISKTSSRPRRCWWPLSGRKGGSVRAGYYVSARSQAIHSGEGGAAGAGRGARFAQDIAKEKAPKPSPPGKVAPQAPEGVLDLLGMLREWIRLK